MLDSPVRAHAPKSASSRAARSGGADWPIASWARPVLLEILLAKGSDENYARRIGAMRMRARSSRCWAGMPHDRKHKRSTCLLRCGISSKNTKACSGRERRVAAVLQRPLHRRRCPNRRQAEGYLPRLLIVAFCALLGVTAGPGLRGRTDSGASWCVCRNEPVVLAETGWSRARTDPPGPRIPLR